MHTTSAPPSFSGTSVDEVLRSHLADKRRDIGETATASAIQAAVGTLDDDLYRRALGAVDLESPQAAPVTHKTPFDIASITKALVGSVLAMQAIDEGRVDWDTPLADISKLWRRRSDPPSKSATFLQLLNHTSGLPAWREFYLEFPLDPDAEQADATRTEILETIAAMPLEGAPGSTHSYSDLGYLLLAHLLEELFEAPLRSLARRRIFEPLGLRHTDYVHCRESPNQFRNAVVTEDCARRGRIVRGTVHDENTNIIGGVSTHAGVFSTADDLLQFGRHLLAIDSGRVPTVEPLVSRDTLQFAWSKDRASTVGHHVAGWDTPSGDRSSAGSGFDREHTVGHLGFTGTSIWIERKRKVVSVLLTNRVYPTRENEGIKDLRIAFQDAILPPQ